MQTMLLTSDHPLQPDGRRQSDPVAGRVVIGDRVCLGAGTLVVPNVTISDEVAAAGSVVTRDCAAGGLYAGAPARRIRDLDVQRRSA